MQIRIDASTTDDAIRTLRNSSGHTIRPESISLGAAVELALWKVHAKSGNGELDRWSRDHEFLHDTVGYVMNGTVAPVRDFEARDSELFGIGDGSDLQSLLFGQFLSRFAAAVRRAGYPEFGQAVSGILQDLADNIPQHSKIGDAMRKVCGLAAYSVNTHRLSFVVADDGVGVLASLRTSREWNHLKSDRDALLAVARDHASRREDQGEGQGYKALFTVLARFNGLVRMRSNTGIFELRGALDQLNPSGAVGPHIPGLQLTVECDLRK